MKKMLVTGGGGFIGHHVVRELHERGDEVTVVDTFREGRSPERVVEGVRYEETDIRKTDELLALCDGVDTVFHMAALPRVQYCHEHPAETTDLNVHGTVSVLEAAMRAGVRRVVYSSSGAVYGDEQSMPLSETRPVSPTHSYGLQKYAGEQFVTMWPKTYPLETVSLRYFNVYGPGLDPRGPYALAVGAFLLARKEGRPITIFGDGTVTRDYVHVRDVARANILAAEREKVGEGEVINVGTGRSITIGELARMFLPRDASAEGAIVYAAPRIEPHDSRADTSRAKELLGWAPSVSLEDGIAELKNEWGLS